MTALEVLADVDRLMSSIKATAIDSSPTFLMSPWHVALILNATQPAPPGYEWRHSEILDKWIMAPKSAADPVRNREWRRGQ